MHRGYIKLWRKAHDAGWVKNHKLWAFWTWCMLKATHKQHDVVVGTQVIRLMPGQFIFGRKKAAEDMNMSEQEIRTLIAFLKKAGNITSKSTNKFSVISIVNWNIYQVNENETNQQINQQLTSNQPTTNHIQEGKEHKKFLIPSIEEISDYCLERKNAIDAEIFFNYYQSNGWKIGKNQMQDWKATVRTWEKRNGGKGNGTGNAKRQGINASKAGTAKSDGEAYPTDYELS